MVDLKATLDMDAPIMISLIPPGSETDPTGWKSVSVRIHGTDHLLPDRRGLIFGTHNNKPFFGVLSFDGPRESEGFCTIPIED